MPEMLCRLISMMEVDDRQRERQREKGKEHDMWNSKTQEADSVLTVSIMIRLTNKPNKHDRADSHTLYYYNYIQL